MPSIIPPHSASNNDPTETEQVAVPDIGAFAGLAAGARENCGDVGLSLTSGHPSSESPSQRTHHSCSDV
jgi:hypothetical protein